MLMPSLRRNLRKAPIPSRAPTLLGVEQEFDLLRGESYIDFRGLFPTIIARTRSVPFRNCDSAAIVDAGYMLACDGREAEFATTPINSARDGCLSLAREASRCRAHMLGLLAKAGVREVRGYSTHLNVGVPIGREWELAAAFSTSIAPALVLLMEARQSPGLLIRPRRGRLEIGSEYIDDEGQLAAALVFLAGAVEAYLRNELLWKQFPRVRLKKWEHANIRPGIYLPHEAYGESMHELGRAARLELESGQKVTAGEIFESCAELALRALHGRVNERAGRALRRVVRQIGSLQIEQEKNPGAIRRRAAYFPATEARTLQNLASARGWTGLTPAFIDWEGAAFSWQSKEAPLILGIPWSNLPQFYTVVRKKELPQFVAKLGPAEAALTSLNQLQSPQAYERVDPVALGTQALNDKGMHAGRKGGAEKPPKQLEYVDLSQTLVERMPLPLESSTLAQTVIARRPVARTDFAQTMVARRAAIPSQGNTVSAASPGSKSRVGWIIAIVTGVVVLSVLGTSVGLIALSHAQPTMTPSPTLSSVGITVLSQANPTPTGTSEPTPAAPQLTPNSTTVNCRYGPGVDYGVADNIKVGQIAAIKGRSGDSFWWYVVDPNNPKALCWVGAAVVTATGNLSDVPIVTPPATPTPKPTRPPKPTKQPKAPPTPTLDL